MPWIVKVANLVASLVAMSIAILIGHFLVVSFAILIGDNHGFWVALVVMIACLATLWYQIVIALQAAALVNDKTASGQYQIYQTTCFLLDGLAVSCASVYAVMTRSLLVSLDGSVLSSWELSGWSAFLLLGLVFSLVHLIVAPYERYSWEELRA